jgi:hypothetical protein
MFPDLIIRRRRYLVAALIIVGLIALPSTLTLHLDRTLKSAYVTSSEAYGEYEEFLREFGNDEFVILAVSPPPGSEEHKVISALDKTTTDLKEIEQITGELSLSNLEILEVSEDKPLGSYPVLERKDGKVSLPDQEEFKMIRKATPAADLLLSTDAKTFGLLFQVKEQYRFDPVMGRVFDSIIESALANFPQGTRVHMIGAPVIREAVQEMVVTTTLRFGILCALIIALVTYYIFKSLRVAFIATAVIGFAVYFVTALMSFLDIPLNSTTSLAFGLVLVVSVATVIHIVSHYYQSEQSSVDRDAALRESLESVARPCFMCALTTSVAFATIMVSSIPMVQQLGLVMSAGVLISFLVSIILTPALLLVLKPVDQRVKDRMSGDWVSSIFKWMHDFVFNHYRFCAYLGIGLVIFMIAGAPRIKVDTQVLRLFKESSDTIEDLRFVEENLAAAQSLELLVEADQNAFRGYEAWMRIKDLENKLLEIPEVKAVESPLPVISHLGWLIVKGPDHDAALENKAVFSDVMLMMRSSTPAREYLAGYLDDDLSTIHLSLRLLNTPSTPVKELIETVRNLAREELGDWAQVTVTGELVVFSEQASEVVDSQVYSLVLAFSAITIIMIIQFRSLALGLLSLIPNLLPIVVIFGVMGWFGIALDNVTVFAATIAIGLSVDDTIHYLTQLRRDIVKSRGTEKRIEDCLSAAYNESAKALISTSSALFFGFLVLSLTPTLPAIYFGFLGATAILAALLGDLVFMPSFILAFDSVKNVVNKEIVGK